MYVVHFNSIHRCGLGIMASFDYFADLFFNFCTSPKKITKGMISIVFFFCLYVNNKDKKIQLIIPEMKEIWLCRNINFFITCLIKAFPKHSSALAQ